MHISVFQPDDGQRHALMHGPVFELALAAGGAISGEHGMGRPKCRISKRLRGPVSLELMRSIKGAFDPRAFWGRTGCLASAQGDRRSTP